MAGESLSGVGSGGMVSKIAAARIATRAGTTVVLTKGVEESPIRSLIEGSRHTIFKAETTSRRARKEWIGASLAVSGSFIIDKGAENALMRGSSLLPAGIVAVEGQFERGDAVGIKSGDGRSLARGLSAYDASDARLIAGHKTSDIERLLGWRGRDEMVHRDDLVLL